MARPRDPAETAKFWNTRPLLNMECWWQQLIPVERWIEFEVWISMALFLDLE
jgi:hypothetical protein